MTRILRADVYDTLELSALMFGGIGRGSYGDSSTNMSVADDFTDSTPCCAVGHIAFASGQSPCGRGLPFSMEMVVTTEDNDYAVRQINERRGRDKDTRVSFAAWCAELKVERGA